MSTVPEPEDLCEPGDYVDPAEFPDGDHLDSEAEQPDDEGGDL